MRMGSNFDQTSTDEIDYGKEYSPKKSVYVVKKDGRIL